MADLDGDGHEDMISGSYWPGHVFWFRGLGEGSFATGEPLTDASGAALHAGKPWASDDEPDMDSLAAAPWLVDFDGDGDLDLLVGNIAGRVVLVRNDGTPKAPSFTAERSYVEADGEPVNVGGGDAGPTTADWDGDGTWDLVIGGGDGSVWFFHNEGSASAPRFAAGRPLIQPVDNGWEPVPAGAAPQRPGVRLKPHVADFDKDGDLDLLVGDFASLQQPAPELTEEQVARRDALQKEQEALMTKLQELGPPGDESHEADRQALLDRWSAIYEELAPLTAQTKPSGWVWFVERRPAGESAR